MKGRGTRVLTPSEMQAVSGEDARTKDHFVSSMPWAFATELGVLVFQFPKVELNEARGLSLLRFPLPAVGVNSKEQPEPKAYTLLHEVIHLMLAAGKEEAAALHEKRSGEEWETVERFAESAASYALVPEDALRVALPRPAGDLGYFGSAAASASLSGDTAGDGDPAAVIRLHGLAAIPELERAVERICRDAAAAHQWLRSSDRSNARSKWKTLRAPGARGTRCQPDHSG